jgi:cation diffusion facilitator family transporter
MQERTNTARRVTWVGFLVNLILTLLKFLAGWLGHSGALIADAAHSLSDFATDVVVLASFRVADKPADRSHDYGHGKYETLATVAIGLALFAAGAAILWNGGGRIWHHFHGAPAEKPGMIALAAATISIVTKEALYRYTLRAGKGIQSQAVIANAWHHRSDAFSSVATVIGVGGAILLGENWRVLDPLAAAVVSFFIIKVAVEIFLSGVRELTEESMDDGFEREISEIAARTPGVTHPHNLRTRRIGSYAAIDLHIRVDPDMHVADAHAIASHIETEIRNRFGQNTLIMIHVEPTSPNADRRVSA